MGDIFLGIIAIVVIGVLIEYLLGKVLPQKPRLIHMVTIIIAIILLGILAVKGQVATNLLGTNSGAENNPIPTPTVEEATIEPVIEPTPTPLYTAGLLTLIRQVGDNKVLEIMKPDGEFLKVTEGVNDFRILATSLDGKYLVIARSKTDQIYDSVRFPKFITTNFYDSRSFFDSPLPSTEDDEESIEPELGTSLLEQGGQGLELLVLSIEDGESFQVFENPVLWIQADYALSGSLIIATIEDSEVVYYEASSSGVDLRRVYTSYNGFNLSATITPMPTVAPESTPVNGE